MHKGKWLACSASGRAPSQHTDRSSHNTPTDPVLTRDQPDRLWMLAAASSWHNPVTQCLSEPRQHHRRLHDTNTHTHRSQEAVSTAKAKAGHPHRGVM